MSEAIKAALGLCLMVGAPLGIQAVLVKRLAAERIDSPRHRMSLFRWTSRDSSYANYSERGGRLLDAFKVMTAVQAVAFVAWASCFCCDVRGPAGTSLHGMGVNRSLLITRGRTSVRMTDGDVHSRRALLMGRCRASACRVQADGRRLIYASGGSGKIPCRSARDNIRRGAGKPFVHNHMNPAGLG